MRDSKVLHQIYDWMLTVLGQPSPIEGARFVGESRDFSNFVEHPRFGRFPIPADRPVSPAEVRRICQKHFYLIHAHVYPETAIHADISRQHCTVMPRPIYVDIRKECRTCQRPFLFFALEQKYWFEELRFFVDTDCVECWECRRAEDEWQQLDRRVAALLADERSLADDQLLDLAGLWLQLHSLGRRKNLERARWALNRIRDRGALASQIDGLRGAIELMEQQS